MDIIVNLGEQKFKGNILDVGAGGEEIIISATPGK